MTSFLERTDFLAEQIGDGTLEVKVEFDQPYAQNQHESAWFKHPHGGQAFYLRDALLEGWAGWEARLGVAVSEGEKLDDVGVHIAHEFADGASRRAPILTGRLRGSDHATVTSDGVLILDDPPLFPRYDPGPDVD